LKFLPKVKYVQLGLFGDVYEHSFCECCGRRLTNPNSVKNRTGPVCNKRKEKERKKSRKLCNQK
jgi:hypothetical protein